jgi:hypothetical protein
MLAASALLGQCTRVVAQEATSQGKALDQLFSAYIRSSAVTPSTPKPPPKKEAGLILNQAVMRTCCERIVKDVQRVFFLRDRSGKMKLQLKGVYSHGPALFFWLQLNNRSVLDYDVDSIRFLITDAAKGRHPPSPSQMSGRLLEPVFVYDSTAMIPGHSKVSNVFVLPRFTLPAGRQLLIHVREKNGGRHLSILTTNWTLERARFI